MTLLLEDPAACLQEIELGNEPAEPGGIVLSETVYDLVRGTQLE